MKKIIPFKKNLSFDTNVSEITSISLENSLAVKENTISGYLIINGTYKITESSIKIDSFEFKLPVDIDIDDKYILENVIIDIDDFFYEIINNNLFEVNIDIKIDNLVEKSVIEESVESNVKRCIDDEVNDNFFEKADNKVVENLIDLDIIDNNIDNVQNEKADIVQIEKINSVQKENVNNDNMNFFSDLSIDSEDYSTYYVYIVRPGDSIDEVISKYKISKELLMEYNDISEVKIGDKLIIPISNA